MASKRPSPSESATQFPVGTTKIGNDGQFWQVIETKSNVRRWSKLKPPAGFQMKKSKGGIAIKAAKGRIATLRKKSGKSPMRLNSSRRPSAQQWQKYLREKRKEDIALNPTPEGLSRREFNKLHTLPRPYKMPGGPAYRKLSRRWWDRFSRERQIEFRRLYPEPWLRKLFPLNSKRLRRKK